MPQTGQVSLGIKVSLVLAVLEILAAEAEFDPLVTPPLRFLDINCDVPSSMAFTTIPPDEPPHAAKDPESKLRVHCKCFDCRKCKVYLSKLP